MYNFAKASVNATDLAARIADVEKDLLGFTDEGGISLAAAQTTWRAKAAALVRESVIDTFKMTDPTPIFTERREGQHGDTYTFERLVNTLRVVQYTPQADPMVFTPRKGVHTIATNQFALEWGIPLTQVMNRQHTLGEFVSMAAEATTRHYANLTLSAIDKACATGVVDLKGRAVRTAAGGQDVAKGEIDAAIRRMFAGNSGVTIFGSRYALDPIFNIAGAQSPDLANELNARGVIGTYRGAKLVEIDDSRNLFYQSWSKVNGVDLEKLIFISAGTPGAILLEKDMSSLDWEDMDQIQAEWRSGIRFDHGILVHSPFLYHVIQLA